MQKVFQKYDASKNYFPVPNAIYYLGLSSGEVAIYGYLLSLEDRKTYSCYPSYKTIGNAVCMSENTVRKYVGELVEKGLITTEPTTIRARNGRRMNGSLLYNIRPIDEAISLYYERQGRTADAMTERSKVKAEARKRGIEICDAEKEV